MRFSSLNGFITLRPENCLVWRTLVPPQADETYISHTTRRSNNPLKTNAQGQSQSQIPVTAVLSSHGAVRVFRTGRSAVRRTGRRFIDNRIPLPPGSPTALHFGCFRKFSPLATGRAADTQIARKCANESLEPCKPLIVSIMGFVRQTREPPCLANNVSLQAPMQRDATQRRAFLARRRGGPRFEEREDADRRGGGPKMDWTKPGRFGRAIAYWALNGISRCGFGHRLHTGLLLGHLTAGSLPLQLL